MVQGVPPLVQPAEINRQKELAAKVRELIAYWHVDCSGMPDTSSERLHIDLLLNEIEDLL